MCNPNSFLSQEQKPPVPAIDTFHSCAPTEGKCSHLPFHVSRCNRSYCLFFPQSPVCVCVRCFFIPATRSSSESAGREGPADRAAVTTDDEGQIVLLPDPDCPAGVRESPLHRARSFLQSKERQEGHGGFAKRNFSPSLCTKRLLFD